MAGYFGLILLAASLFTSWTFAELQQSVSGAQEWKQIYSKVFAKTADELSAESAGSHLMFLHKTIAVANLDNSVTNDMKDNAKYCYDLLTDLDTGHCNLKHMDSAKERLLSIPHTNEWKMSQVFVLVHQNLVDICIDKYRHYAETLQKNIVNTYFLEGYAKLYAKYAAGELPKSELKALVLEGIRARKRDSAQDLVQRWSEKSCGALNSLVKKFNSEPFHEFAALHSNHGLKYKPNDKDIVNNWAGYVNACDKIEKMLPDFAKREPGEANKPNIFKRMFKMH